MPEQGYLWVSPLVLPVHITVKWYLSWDTEVGASPESEGPGCSTEVLEATSACQNLGSLWTSHICVSWVLEMQSFKHCSSSGYVPGFCQAYLVGDSLPTTVVLRFMAWWSTLIKSNTNVYLLICGWGSSGKVLAQCARSPDLIPSNS